LLGGYLDYFSNFANNYIHATDFEKQGHLNLILTTRQDFLSDIGNKPLKEFLNQDFSHPRFDEQELDKDKSWL
jgi:hypothetical protein